MLLDWLIDIAIAAATVLGVRPAGRALVRLVFRRPRRFPGEYFLSVGLGLFFLEMIMVALGWAGMLSRIAAVLLLTLCVGGAAAEFVNFVLRFRGHGGPHLLAAWKDAGWREGALAAGIALCLLVYLAGALLPPLSYDALEYHLGAPHMYIQEGRTYRIPGNVYSEFPFNTEMLYTYALLLRPDGIVAKLFHYAFGLLAAGGLISLGISVKRPIAGLGAALLFLASPITARLAISADIDLAVAFFAVCALVAIHLWLEERSRSTLALAGAFVGTALGCKYIAIVVTAVPAAAAVAVASFMPRETEGFVFSPVRVRDAVRNVLILAAVSLVLLSPWLVKNLLVNGNPFFPLLYETFGGRHWSLEEFRLFRAAHAPTLPGRLDHVFDGFGRGKGFERFAAFVKDLWRALTNGSIVATLLFVPLGRKHLRRVPILYASAVFAFIGYLGWLLFTNQVDRFLTPLFPAIALPLAYFCLKPGRTLPLAEMAIVGLLVFALTTCVSLARGLRALGGTDYLSGRITEEQYRELGLPHFTIVRAINELPAGEHPKILMTAEARPFGIRYPVEMSTVFNRSGLVRRFEEAGSVEALDRELIAERFTHVFDNEIERARLESFYGGLGWRDGEKTRSIIDRMVGADLLEPVAVSRADSRGRRAVLYRLR